MANVKMVDRYGYKIWKIEDKEKYALVDFSCSRKVKDNDIRDKARVKHGIAKNGYVSENYKYAMFVGHAYNKLKGIKEENQIYNLTSLWDKEAFWNEETGSTEYPKYPKIVVFDFDTSPQEEVQLQKNLDKAPEVEQETEKDEKKISDEECPF